MIDVLERLVPRRWAGSVRQLHVHLKTPLYANAYLLILNQGLSAVLGLMYWVAAARIYSTELTGQGSAIISTLGYVSALAELSLKSGMQRFVPMAGRQVRKLVLLTYGVVLLASALILAAFLFAGDLFNFSDHLLGDLNHNMLAFFVLATMLYTVFIVQDGVLMGLRQTVWVLLENTFFNVSKVVLLFVGISGLFGNGIAASWFIPAPFVVLAVNLLVFFRFIPRYLAAQPEQTSPIQPRLIVKSVGGDHVGTILSETSFRLLPLMIINLLGTSANAYFYQAWLMGTMLYLVSSNVASSFTVEAASNPASIAAFSRQSLRHSLTLAVPMTLLLVVGAPLVLQIYGGQYAQEGAPLLRWLALAAVPYAINAWFLAYSRVKADVKSIIVTQGVQCALTLGLSYLWMPVYGIASIGLAWLIAQLVISGMVLGMTRKVLFAREPAVEPVPVTGEALPLANEEPPQVEPLLALPTAKDGKTILILSPHLDDAVLSCGGLIARLARAGEKVVIVTFFTGDPPAGQELSWLAQRNLRAWNLERSPAPFAERRAEDQAAAARLRVETLHLGLLDAMLRTIPEGQTYYTQNTVGVPINPVDAWQTGEVLREWMLKIKDQYSQSSCLRVVAPVGLSQHVDHLLVRDVAQAVFCQEQLSYYEELPYVTRAEGWTLPEIQARPGDERGGLAWQSTLLTLTPQEIEAWVDATACYCSQITGLFPLPIERTLEVLYSHTPYLLKPLWDIQDRRLRPAEASARVRQYIKGYLQKNGGVKLWSLSAPVPARESEVENHEAHHQT